MKDVEYSFTYLIIFEIERFELKGLRKFTEYSIYLEAYNQVGTSPKSSPSVIARTLEDGE